MNDYKTNARFILTSNNINLIDGAIMSRLLEINFNPQDENEKNELRKKIALKIKKIFDAEGITVATNEEKKF
ncbi:MAG: hypothetical protein GXO50_06665, partial [Chlorobi bacterium]|nr:hypothetical protein [Chlorobiota bacterium]